MYEVLIVGAGISGMRLAQLLQQRGTHYCLIDARFRLGGRIVSQSMAEGVQPESGHHRYDLGPSWVWPNQPRINQLARQLGIKLYPQYDQGTLVYQDQFGSIDTTINAAPMSGSLRVQGGQQSIIDRLSTKLEAERVWLNHTVRSITQAEAGVSIKCATPCGTKTILAQRIVLAVPPRLVAKSISFFPKLKPEQTQVMGDIPTWMAGQSKFTAVYSKPFWRDHGLSGDGVSRIGPLSEIHDASPENESRGALFGFFGWPVQQRQAPEKELIEQAVTQLRQMFGPEAAHPLQVSLQDWAADPLTATAADVEQKVQPQCGSLIELDHLWQGRIMFSSAETAKGFSGLVEGALEAAEKVFNDLIAYDVNH